MALKKNMDKNNDNRIAQLEEKLKTLERKFAVHQHNNVDGTNILRKNIMLDKDQWISVGAMQQLGDQSITGVVSDQYVYAMSVGSDQLTTGFTNKSSNLQLNFIHYPNNSSLQSFITAFRKPLATNFNGTVVATTIGGTTVTINGFNFTTNELTGALIDIFNNSGTLVETQTIASNTATVITISATWLASTTNAFFRIYVPVFCGEAGTIWQRFYTQEGTGGGIRFGVGTTAGGQNGLLYSDATGDLYWRNKAGVSTKLN